MLYDMIRRCAVLLVLSLSTNALAESPRVIVISVDGLRADMVSQLRMPNLFERAARGFQAHEALNDLPASTVTNHATMLTGITAQQHGILAEIGLPNQIPQPTIMTYAAAAGLKCGFFATKSKLSFLVNRDQCAQVLFEEDSATVIESCLDFLQHDDPDFVFLHLRDPDSAGHRAGWLSDEYFVAVQEADQLIERVAAAVLQTEIRPTYIIITADHGGEGNSHFWSTPSVRLIPWIVLGPAIQADVDFPGPIFTADTMPTSLALLRLALPTNVIGRDLTVHFLTSPEDNPPALISADFRNDPIPSASLPCIIFSMPAILILLFVMPKKLISAGLAA